MSYIKEQIRILCAVQDIDSQKQRLIYKLESYPHKIALIESKMKEHENNLKSKEIMLASLEHEYRKSENNEDDLASNIRKSKEKLSQVKSNKEYRLTLKEIDTLNEKRANLEDIMLECLRKIEKTEALIRNEMKLLVVHKETSVNEKNTLLDKELREKLLMLNLDKRIKKVRESADPKILSTFDAICKKIKKTPVASVQNSVCRGCNMSIPPQLTNELQGFNELKFCPYCKRIIYWSSEL